MRIVALLLLLALSACQNSHPKPAAEPPAAFAHKPAPDELFGELFHAVQMARIFPDGKTFVDCTPKNDAATIMEAYNQEKGKTDFRLQNFVNQHFATPEAKGGDYHSELSQSPADHITDLWPVLTRSADAPEQKGSLLPLPNPYVVPGGRFREIYYWDSYFTMLGLESAGRKDLIENMVKNFVWLIDTYGHIPNGNRSYYLSRSQPPFFSLMVALLGDEKTKEYLPALEKEYAFWMDGADRLNATMPQHRRALWLPDGAVMNRYWDDRPAPRPESYKEDYETAAEQANKEDTYRHLKAGAESGWDFSSRWFADGKSIKTIQTTHIIPVDLNCLMWHLETLIAKGHELKGDSQKAAFFAQKAAKRAAAIQKYCYQADKKWYFDYHWKNNSATPVASLAGFFPLFFHMTDPKQAKECIQTLTEKFVRPGGLVTTENNTGQQWDAPNGWAPLQWIGIVGLRNYEATQLADELKKRWVALNTKVYARTGKMMEKYNVEDLSLDAGGGEYPVQDGFGWTNGVLLRLLSERQ